VREGGKGFRVYIWRGGRSGGSPALQTTHPNEGGGGNGCGAVEGSGTTRTDAGRWRIAAWLKVLCRMTHEEQETSSIATGGRDSDEMMMRDGGCEREYEQQQSRSLEIVARRGW
jgi:hypothetical protein